MANDKSFQDPTNLENKLQRHQEFNAEVNANEKMIKNISKVLNSILVLSPDVITSNIGDMVV